MVLSKGALMTQEFDDGSAKTIESHISYFYEVLEQVAAAMLVLVFSSQEENLPIQYIERAIKTAEQMHDKIKKGYSFDTEYEFADAFLDTWSSVQVIKKVDPGIYVTLRAKLEPINQLFFASTKRETQTRPKSGLKLRHTPEGYDVSRISAERLDLAKYMLSDILDAVGDRKTPVS